MVLSGKNSLSLSPWSGRATKNVPHPAAAKVSAASRRTDPVGVTLDQGCCFRVARPFVEVAPIIGEGGQINRQSTAGKMEIGVIKIRGAHQFESGWAR